MLHLLAPLPANTVQLHDIVSGLRVQDVAARAGLIDLDVTIIPQAAFFFLLLLVLPGLVYKPMLSRFDQRGARTEGARGEAKGLRRQADDEVARYEVATAEGRRRALGERAETREQARRQADEMVSRARSESQGRLDGTFADQRKAAEAARALLKTEAGQIAASIADKLAQG